MSVTTWSDRSTSARRRYGFGFWAVAFAFLAVMGLSAAPSPLYALYQRR
jgi:hypothetical protein